MLQLSKNDKSTRYNFIAFHIVITLIGYMYFQLFKNMEEGSKCLVKSLPVIIKNYKENKQKSIIIYSGQYFGVFSLKKTCQSSDKNDTQFSDC
ncbi:hypothetical protein CLMAG_48470 [Clostridium magnum DSM 2767]|uniref:Uncharacterized protein n=1 Tax=Clostridium magnum DSM 2767 TaxID=1121326 RepID=A0A162RFR3_9CLOT|nr:hypothetical protein CLMAG_48470 [Clostridium magnum DSM 2767]SHI70176.1 hypothetical protein SAMN02745944_04711 [Clostridium magnum DSM 2767]